MRYDHQADKPPAYHWRGAGNQHRQKEDNLCLRLELERLVRSLPEPLRTVARMLLDGYTQDEIAAALGLARGRPVRRSIEQVRTVLRQRFYPERAQIGPKLSLQK